MVHARLTCQLSPASREAALAAEVAVAPAMHALAGDAGKQLPHRPPGSDRAGKPSTLRAAAAAATGFAGGSSSGPVLLRTRMAETVNGARTGSHPRMPRRQMRLVAVPLREDAMFHLLPWLARG
jgi:hypothetical protein